MRAGMWLAFALFVGGVAMLLSEVPVLTRLSIVDRLAPFCSSAPRSRFSPSAGQFTAMPSVSMTVRRIGDAIASACGISDDISIRLKRVASHGDPAAFRLRQATWSIGWGVTAATAALTLGAPLMVTALVTVSSAILGALVVEQALLRREGRSRRVRQRELPVVAEQLGTLVAAGYSTIAALDRICRRGSGLCAQDLTRVVARVRQGAALDDALAEWVAVADTDGVRRLAALLALDQQTAELSRLIGDESRTLNRDLHRELAATIEQRAQQVWIPVTIATIVPGALFLGVPFMSALERFLGS
ncbi:MAG: type II secretion system F family protein [Nitriliruptoraceae bacterium]